MTATIAAAPSEVIASEATFAALSASYSIAVTTPVTPIIVLLLLVLLSIKPRTLLTTAHVTRPIHTYYTATHMQQSVILG